MSLELYLHKNEVLEKFNLSEWRQPCGCCGSMVTTPQTYENKNFGLIITFDSDRVCRETSDYWEEKVLIENDIFMFIKHRKKGESFPEKKDELLSYLTLGEGEEGHDED